MIRWENMWPISYCYFFLLFGRFGFVIWVVASVIMCHFFLFIFRFRSICSSFLLLYLSKILLFMGIHTHKPTNLHSFALACTEYSTKKREENSRASVWVCAPYFRHLLLLVIHIQKNELCYLEAKKIIFMFSFIDGENDRTRTHTHTQNRFIPVEKDLNETEKNKICKRECSEFTIFFLATHTHIHIFIYFIEMLWMMHTKKVYIQANLKAFKWRCNLLFISSFGFCLFILYSVWYFFPLFLICVCVSRARALSLSLISLSLLSFIIIYRLP